jgi:hypothetical protein
MVDGLIDGLTDGLSFCVEPSMYNTLSPACCLESTLGKPQICISIFQHVRQVTNNSNLQRILRIYLTIDEEDCEHNY